MSVTKVGCFQGCYPSLSPTQRPFVPSQPPLSCHCPFRTSLPLLEHSFLLAPSPLILHKTPWHSLSHTTLQLLLIPPFHCVFFFGCFLVYFVSPSVGGLLFGGQAPLLFLSVFKAPSTSILLGIWLVPSEHISLFLAPHFSGSSRKEVIPTSDTPITHEPFLP